MDMESQKILFALSTPMEIRNECCLPSHSSPKMYLGTCFFDLSSSWGIDARDRKDLPTERNCPIFLITA